MKRHAFNLALAVATPLLLVVVWYGTSSSSTNAFFPPLRQILSRFADLWLFEHFTSDILPSLGNLVVGFVSAVVLGVALGFVLATVPLLRAMFEPSLHLLRGIPPVALVPILITLVGFGNEMRISSIMIAAVFPTMIATIDGIRAVDSGLKDVCTVYQLSKRDRLLSVYLPSAGPQIAAGMQVSLLVAFIVMIASEMMGTAQGIGAMTLLAQQTFMAADMWAGILLLGLIGFLSNLLFDLIKNRVLSWYIGSKKMEKVS
ncbi:ABC transporter permease subunit [Glutamicibacter sp. MNS18]|uniref:ABC transporter permease n=1 Tax=Glutamicibacter sp. MNS18 TaxID=2989817 RepID=UPI00223663AD|nr:ABC transporter permease subunit [Glutamicibacter sp. MNS18]MCW4465591.1 ABC transporter permease subunit [Glutamicibacter sp. MNS18]